MTNGHGILNLRKCKECGEKYDAAKCPYCIRRRIEEKNKNNCANCGKLESDHYIGSGDSPSDKAQYCNGLYESEENNPKFKSKGCGAKSGMDCHEVECGRDGYFCDKCMEDQNETYR